LIATRIGKLDVSCVLQLFRILFLKTVLLSGILFCLPAITLADEENLQNIDKQVEALKKDVISVNRDLFVLEEELLFPANTQTFYFLSMEGTTFFDLDSVELKIDGKVAAHYLYTEREVMALAKGGVQRLHVNNLNKGEHEIIAVFIGKGPQGRDYRRGATYTFEKGFDPKFIELKIIESEQKNQPEFAIKEWE